jgi:O-succinylbenzoic acid--CoA ligase
MTLTQNSQTYTLEQIISTLNEKGSSSINFWENDLFEFLKDWYDKSDVIQAQTSGSTGIPKTIFLNKESMIASAKLTNQYFGLKKNNTILLCLSTNFIAGKMMVVRAIVGNLNLLIIEPSSCPIIDQPIDFAAMVPMQVESLLSSTNGKTSLDMISKLIIGGSAVSSQLETKLESISTACYATYGMTETVSHIALRSLNGQNRSNEYQALEGVWFEQDERECLVVHAPHINKKELITNDIVLLKSKTSFEWCGRFDNVINSGGIKLFPEIMENKIAPLIEQRFYISSQKDELLGEKVILIIEGEVFSTVDLQNLRMKLSTSLNNFEMPRAFVFIPKFEETSTGKVKRVVQNLPSN